MLRPAEPKDAAAIGAIRVAAWQAAYPAFLPAHYLAALDPNAHLEYLQQQLNQQNEDFSVWLATTANQVVAFCITGKPRYSAPANCREIWALNVLPRYWRQGFAQQLLTHCVNTHKNCYAQLMLWCIAGNSAAERCYEQLGFTLSGQERTTSQLTGHPLHECEHIKLL